MRPFIGVAAKGVGRGGAAAWAPLMEIVNVGYL